ncbi:hypothetical protein QYF36_025335 [Acer negundo]|nr:hypothetical protein QYF36_025335 [Acer negundo]
MQSVLRLNVSFYLLAFAFIVSSKGVDKEQIHLLPPARLLLPKKSTQRSAAEDDPRISAGQTAGQAHASQAV